MYRVKNRKWTNAESCFYNGEKYDSKYEASYAMYLDCEKKAGRIKRWERQVKVELVVNGFLVCIYKLDFLVYHNDESLEYVETKGFHTDYWRLKWKLFEALYSEKPDVKLTIVQQGNGKRPPKARKIKKTNVFK